MARMQENQNDRLFALGATLVIITKGLTFGYLYGRLAHLPAIPIAKAFTIWEIAKVAFVSVMKALNFNRPTEDLLFSAFIIATTTIGIQEMQKRNLLGYKMKIFLIVSTTADIAMILLFTWKPKIEDHGNKVLNQFLKDIKITA